MFLGGPSPGNPRNRPLTRPYDGCGKGQRMTPRMEEDAEPNRGKATARRRDATPASTRTSRRERPLWAAALLASVALHALAFLLWRGAAPLGDPRTADRRAATPRSGGGAAIAVFVGPPRQARIPPPPAPVLAIEAPEVEPDQPAAPSSGPDLRPATALAMPGIGGGTGPGPSGQGSGDGTDYVSPVPRSVLPYWDPPPSVRGLEVTVRILIDDTGRPTGMVELDPPTPDGRFNKEIITRVRRMEYHPARRNGAPVAGWAEITFVF